MIKNTFLYCFLLSCLLVACTSQKPTNESTEETISLLQKKSSETLSDSTLIYLRDVARLIKSTPSLPDSLKSENDFLIGDYYSKKGQIDSAAVYHYKAIESIKDSIQSDREYQYFFNAWSTHQQLQEYGECIAITRRFESLIKESDNTNLLRVYYQYIETYKASKKYQEAIKYIDLSIETYKELKNTKRVIITTITKTELQFLYLNKEEAYSTLEKLLLLKEELDFDLKRQLYTQYGYYLHLDQRYKEARDYYHKGLSAINHLEKTPFLTTEYTQLYSNLGEVYLDLKVYDSAKFYLDKASQEDKLSNSNDKTRQLLSYKLRYAYETKSNYKETQNHLDTIAKYQEMRYEERYSKGLKSLESSYKEKEAIRIEKQQVELEKAKTQIQLLIVFIISSLLITLGIYFYKKRQRTFDKMSLQMQQRLLRSQMNPHFTFNTLYAIQNTIKKDPQGAVNYLLKFSRLLRLILENSTNNYVLLEKELESLRKYMDLQLLRFPEKYTYTITLQDLEEDEFIFIPPMLIQPYIENSIEHAFKGINYKGKIHITLSLKKEFIKCIIEDNGIGIQSKVNSHKESVSTTLIANFIEKATKQKINDINKKDRDPSTSGMITSFLIPYKQTEHD
ncbi:histidine kinase [uncultured Dokdonia sp.]|uniref:tetratricopeptide repeat-containing sensor histidine kinase n=1 Tax=uncultured Dokdonia sp. TaxID=575653 RepID=UPI002620702D|nr:histidine kinase [uncultured Dokdonia sp.]